MSECTAAHAGYVFPVTFFFFFSAAGVLLLAGVSHYAEYPWGDYVNVGLDPC